MRRLTASHPDYERINILMHLLAAARNPQVHFDINADHETSDKLLWKARINDLESELEDLLGGGMFRDFISNLDGV